MNRLHRVINCFACALTRPATLHSESMEAVTEYPVQKNELEEKIRSLETEKTTLLADISTLKEKIAEFELEKSAKSLESDVQALRTEKAVLEEKVAGYEAEAGYDLPSSTAVGF